MHPCAHVASTGFIVISHALSLNIDKIVMIYYLITYTFIERRYRSTTPPCLETKEKLTYYLDFL